MPVRYLLEDIHAEPFPEFHRFRALLGFKSHRFSPFLGFVIT
jgi:hypothetical protein